MADHNSPTKKGTYLNPNERKVNQQIKSSICANRFYEHIEEQKTAVSDIWTKHLEDGMTTLDMTLDLSIIDINQKKNKKKGVVL